MLDFAIIGGGPAGLTAGLYATRGGLKEVTMFEMGMPGGQITQSSEIENYPGQLEVVTGMELMDKWPEQCKRFGLKHEMAEIKQVTKSGDIFTLTLANICKTVYIVHRRDEFKASPHEVEKLEKFDNIVKVMNHTTEEIIGDAMGVTGVIVKDKTTGETKTLDGLGCFVFVGRNILNDTLKQEDGSFLCDTNEAGEVIVNLKMETSVPGLFAAGDIRIDAPKQVVCAAGDGAVAGIG
ncbi:thioredoxin-disulfide reductase, partial [Aduncisulcus paluster]